MDVCIQTELPWPTPYSDVIEKIAESEKRIIRPIETTGTSQNGPGAAPTSYDESFKLQLDPAEVDECLSSIFSGDLHPSASSSIQQYSNYAQLPQSENLQFSQQQPGPSQYSQQQYSQQPGPPQYSQQPQMYQPQTYQPFMIQNTTPPCTPSGTYNVETPKHQKIQNLISMY